VTITVLMLQTRRGDAGAFLTAGQSYDLRDDLARELVGLGYAQDTFGVIDNTRDSLADISLSLSSAQLGKLNDAGTPIPKGTLLRDPVNGLIYGQSDGVGDWTQLAAGGGGGGGGDDPTDWGSFTAGKPGTVTVNGVQWVIGYTGDNITSYTVALTGADDLVVAVSYDNGYAEYSGNINVGGAVRMTAAQARYLASEVLSALGAAANGFKIRVTGLFYTTLTANATPIYHDGCMEWQNNRFRAVSGCVFSVWHNASHVANSAESAVLTTVVMPNWLNKAGAVWRAKIVQTASGGAASTMRTRIKINGDPVVLLAEATGGSGTDPTNGLEVDYFCVTDSAQFVLPAASSATGGTCSTSAAYLTASINSASTDLTLTTTVQLNNTDVARSGVNRLTRVELLP